MRHLAHPAACLVHHVLRPGLCHLGRSSPTQVKCAARSVVVAEGPVARVVQAVGRAVPAVDPVVPEVDRGATAVVPEAVAVAASLALPAALVQGANLAVLEVLEVEADLVVPAVEGAPAASQRKLESRSAPSVRNSTKWKRRQLAACGFLPGREALCGFRGVPR
jgi:hypothetical protein